MILLRLLERFLRKTARRLYFFISSKFKKENTREILKKEKFIKKKEKKKKITDEGIEPIKNRHTSQQKTEKATLKIDKNTPYFPPKRYATRIENEKNNEKNSEKTKLISDSLGMGENTARLNHDRYVTKHHVFQEDSFECFPYSDPGRSGFNHFLCFYMVKYV